MNFIKLLLAAILSISVMSPSFAYSDVDSAYTTVDSHDTIVVVMSESLVRSLWEEAVTEQGLIYDMRVNDGIGVHGMIANFINSAGEEDSAMVSDLIDHLDELPDNWISINYFGRESVTGDYAFVRNPETGGINFYRPGASKF